MKASNSSRFAVMVVLLGSSAAFAAEGGSPASEAARPVAKILRPLPTPAAPAVKPPLAPVVKPPLAPVVKPPLAPVVKAAVAPVVKPPVAPAVAPAVKPPVAPAVKPLVVAPAAVKPPATIAVKAPATMPAPAPSVPLKAPATIATIPKFLTPGPAATQPAAAKPTSPAAVVPTVDPTLKTTPQVPATASPSPATTQKVLAVAVPAAASPGPSAVAKAASQPTSSARLERKCLSTEVAQFQLCDGGQCSPEVKYPCVPYRCFEASGTCGPSCRANADCAQNHACVSGKCTFRWAYCADAPGSSEVDGGRYSVTADGRSRSCWPYRCAREGGGCETECTSRAQCGPTFICTVEGRCAKR